MNGTSIRQPAEGWRAALAALMLVLAWVLFWYWDTLMAMVTIWVRSETFTHAFLVPPISLWLIWRQRRLLSTLPPSINWWMPLILLLAGFGWLLGELAAVNSVTHLALISLLVFSVPAVLGIRPALAMAFPLAYLYFAAPIGEFVVPQFMEWTAYFTVQALNMSGIPVYREGLHFVIPSGKWSVVTACSGVRYLIASVVVGTLYAYLNYRSLQRRLVFIGVSIVVPVVANWMRAYLIVMIGHLSNNQLAVGVDHLIYGWIFFGVVILALFAIGARWAEHPDPNEDSTGAFGPVSATASTGSRWMMVLVVALVTALPQLSLVLLNRDAGAASSPVLSLAAPEGWEAVPIRGIDFRPTFGDPSAELHTEFRQGEQRVVVFVAYYRNQNYDRKLVSSENTLVKPGDPVWAPAARRPRQIRLGDQEITVSTTELRNTSDFRILSWQWYWINGHLTTSDYAAKAYTAVTRLMGQGDDSAVVVLYAPKEQPGGGEAAMEAFVRVAGGAIDAALRQARERP
jgi:exosortase A